MPSLAFSLYISSWSDHVESRDLFSREGSHLVIDPSLPAANINFTDSEVTAEPVPQHAEDGGGWLGLVKLA